MLLNHRTLFETTPVLLNKTEVRSGICPWTTRCNLDLSKYMMLVSGSFLRYLEQDSHIITPASSLSLMDMYTHTNVSSSQRMLVSDGVKQASGRAVVELAWLIKQCGHRRIGHSTKTADIAAQTSARAGGIRILVFPSVGS